MGGKKICAHYLEMYANFKNRFMHLYSATFITFRKTKTNKNWKIGQTSIYLGILLHRQEQQN